MDNKKPGVLSRLKTIFDLSKPERPFGNAGTQCMLTEVGALGNLCNHQRIPTRILRQAQDAYVVIRRHA